MTKGRNSLAMSGLGAGAVCFCAGMAYVAFPHGLPGLSESPLCAALVGKILPTIGLFSLLAVISHKLIRAEAKSGMRVCSSAPFFLLLLAIGMAITVARLVVK